MLKNQIVDDLSEAIKNKRNSSDLKVLVGEIQRLKDKDPSDDDVIALLTKLKNDELITLTKLKKDESSSPYLQLILRYLPPEETKLTEDELREWIKNNIDFSQYKKKLDCIKDIKLQLKGRFDGPKTKEVLLKWA